MTYQNLTSEELSILIKYVRPEFKNWAWHSFIQGHLDLLIQGIMRAGKAGSRAESLLYLEEYQKTLPQKDKVTWGDVAKTSRNQRLSKLLSEIITGERNSSAYDKSRYHGIISHIAIPELFSGNLLNMEKISRGKLQSPEQHEIFHNGISLELLRLDKTKSVKLLRLYESLKLIEYAEAYLEKVEEDVRKGMLPHQSKSFPQLRESLRPIFEEYMQKILTNELMENEYLSSHTFMIWAKALTCYKYSGNLAFFREVPVLANAYDLGAGRIDALFVRTIDGKTPDKAQTERVKAMTKRQFHSVGHLMNTLLRAFGDKIDFKVTAWKFAVGDGERGMRSQMNVVKVKDVEDRPLDGHERQIKRYLSMAILSHSLSSLRHIDEVEKIWETKSFSMKGEIAYFFPDKQVFHDVVLTPEKIKLFFQEQVVSNFVSAKRRATFRHTSNALFNHAINLVNENEKKIPGKSTQLFMEEVIPAPKIQVSSVIERYVERKFADERGLIEIVGTDRKGEKILEMHLDRVIKAIEDGYVQKARGFDSARKILVCCILHEEKTPSMHITYNRGFKCFGCGAHGRFATDSIPEDVHVVIQPLKVFDQENRATQKLVIKQRHREIMLLAQELLSGAFLGSRGSEYIARFPDPRIPNSGRGLDPELSHQFGAGFGTLGLIPGLLERGFSYGELLEHGFLRISPNVREQSRVVELLIKPGFKLNEIARPDFVKKDGELERVNGLPYSELNERLTYPLEIGGIINSFYGRSIIPNCSPNFAHRKLSNEHNGMPHGAFNMTKSMLSGATEILVTEAPIDADTFMQKSDCKADTAIIGVNNDVLCEELAGFSGNIILALDNDIGKKRNTGAEETIKFTEKLKYKGFKGQIYDFTAGMVKNNPAVNYKDANRYW